MFATVKQNLGCGSGVDMAGAFGKEYRVFDDMAG